MLKVQSRIASKHFSTFCRYTHQQVTAGCLVIGNEILNGSVQDANISPLAKTLFNRGVQLKTVRIIGDEEFDICKSLHEMNKEVDYIFTTGGIGPTHDDITYEAIAKAYNTTLQLDKETEYLLGKELTERGSILNDERRKMCIFPANSTIYRTETALMELQRNSNSQIGEKSNDNTPEKTLQQKTSWVPLVVVKNCFIFPGVPSIFRNMLSDFAKYLPESNDKIISSDLFIQMPEGEIAKVLSDTEKHFATYKFPLQIGSYPNVVEGKTFKVRVSLRSISAEVIEEAEKMLCKALPFRK